MNTYCSVLRQVFVGWAWCRVLVRCGGFFLGWLVPGIAYGIVTALGGGGAPATAMFFPVHMVLCLLMMSQKYYWFEAALGKETVRDTHSFPCGVVCARNDALSMSVAL